MFADIRFPICRGDFEPSGHFGAVECKRGDCRSHGDNTGRIDIGVVFEGGRIEIPFVFFDDSFSELTSPSNTVKRRQFNGLTALGIVWAGADDRRWVDCIRFIGLRVQL